MQLQGIIEELLMNLDAQSREWIEGWGICFIWENRCGNTLILRSLCCFLNFMTLLKGSILVILEHTSTLWGWYFGQEWSKIFRSTWLVARCVNLINMHHLPLLVIPTFDYSFEQLGWHFHEFCRGITEGTGQELWHPLLHTYMY